LIQDVKNEPARSSVDDRGFLISFLPEGLPSFKAVEIYATGNFSEKTIRGLHKHKLETKVFFAVSGAAKFVAIDDRKDSPTYKEINSFVLTPSNPTVLTIPPGVYSGWMSLTNNTTIIGIADREYDKDSPDDERIDPFAFGDVWEVQSR